MGIINPRLNYTVVSFFYDNGYCLCYRTMESLISGSGASVTLEETEEGYNAEDKELDVIDTDEINEISDFKQKLDDHENNEEENEDGKKKTPVWKKPQKKKQTKKQDKNAGKQKQKQKQKPKANDPASAQGDSAQNAQVRTPFEILR